MFEEEKHPRDDGGKFTEKGGEKKGYDSKDDLGSIRNVVKDRKKMTPAEKIASVHIDFDKDNILPELDETSLQKMGVSESKPVLVKASLIARNSGKHPEIDPKDVDELIGKTLYEPDEIVHGKNPNKPYYSFLKKSRISEKSGNTEYGTVLLDVSAENKNFEIVHWHWVREQDLKSIKPKQ